MDSLVESPGVWRTEKVNLRADDGSLRLIEQPTKITVTGADGLRAFLYLLDALWSDGKPLTFMLPTTFDPGGQCWHVTSEVLPIRVMKED